MAQSTDSAEQTEFSIRRAEIRDVREIRAIDMESFPSPWSESLTITQVTGRDRVHYVAVRDHRVIGHGGLVFLAHEAHVATIAVASDYWGQGVGDALMDRLLEAAEANGHAGLTLEVRESNLRAIALYERHGLAIAGRRKGYYENDGEDALIMTSDSLRAHG